MSTLVVRPANAPARSAGATYATIRQITRFTFLLGVFCSLLGFSWDVQWHSDVGPDTFFTAPHLVLYSGIAIAGLSCLIVVLLTTFRYRGVATDTVSILGGRFAGPAGYIIGGLGALMFLAYGLLDQWWHGIYGFDVTLVSPPHFGLIFSVLISMIGCLILFASDVRRAQSDGTGAITATVGFALAAVLLTAFVTPTVIDASLVFGSALGIRPDPSGSQTVIVAMLLLLSAAVIRRPWAATLTALVYLLLRLSLWEFVPFITREYADSLGLFIRDNVTGKPVVPGLMAAYLPLAGLAVDAVLTLGRRQRWNVRLTVLAAGAVVPIAVHLLEAVPAAFTIAPALVPIRSDLFTLNQVTTFPILVLALGAVAGYLGWAIGSTLRFAGMTAQREAAATSLSSTASTVSSEGPGLPATSAIVSPATPGQIGGRR